jgi:glycosyltransferase involved in cell wall biosynthesis
MNADVKGSSSEEELQQSHVPQPSLRAASSSRPLQGKRVAVVLFAAYPADPRPRRAAEVLVKEGMNVDLICLAADETEPRRETFNGVNIFRIPMRHRRGGKLAYLFSYSVFTLSAFAILAFRSLIRRYDLVHVHNMPDILVLSTLVPKAFGAKTILDLHDPMPELMMTIFGLDHGSPSVRLLERLEKWSIGLADSVLTPNLAFQKLFVSRSCPPEKINVVMNSPDDEIFRFHPRNSHTPLTHGSIKPFVIMYHGALLERNGVDLAVDALVRVRRSLPTAELRIYGHKTPFLDHVLDSLRAKGLLEAVRYLGPKLTEGLVEAIEECDVGIVPNRRSAFSEINMPTRIFEYLALGRPVIAPRTRGIQDYFRDDALLFFELGDSEDLARQIEYVGSHPSEAVETVKRGQQVYLDHTWRREKLRFVNLVAELLRANGARGA